MSNVIDLADYKTSPESKVFSGRPRGEYCRSLLKLDAVDAGPDPIVVQIPRDAYAVNMSFFLGLFGPSVRRLGVDGFFKHYQFKGSQHILQILPAYAEEALQDEIALPRSQTA